MSTTAASRRRRLVVGAVVALDLLVFLVVLAERIGTLDEGFDDLPLLVIVVVTVAFGALLTMRVPTNRTGVILLTTGSVGAWAGLTTVLDPGAVDAYSVVQVVVYASGLATYVGFLWLAFGVIPLVFPTGSPPTPRWRWVWFVGLTAVVGLGLLTLVAERICGASSGTGCAVWGENPLGIGGMSAPEDTIAGAFMLGAIAVSVLGGAGSLIVRWRRATGIERQQIGWFAASVSVSVSTFLLYSFVWIDMLRWPELPLDEVILSAVFATIPVSIAIAVTRYHLYDLGRVVSRTATYAVLAALIVGAYAVGAVWLPTRLGIENPTFVAATTLAIAVAFNPVRRWLTSRLDRRFNRMRYDPQAVVDDLSVRLRDRTDAGAISTAWATAVNDALEPAAISVWTAE